MNKQNNDKTKEVKDSRIIVRVTEKEKSFIDERVKRSNMKLSEYIRHQIFFLSDNKEGKVNNVKLAVLAIELVRYVEEKDGGLKDKNLRKMVDEIWEMLF